MGQGHRIILSQMGILEQFGARVREKRAALSLSQEAFAAKCGLDRTYISGIERGKRNVSLKNIAVIAKALGITISDLAKGLAD
ncbi:MAG: helix-turn-helix domain-containing protein [Gemmataceae bacterium]|nr:helix-turn-helix domain-containing protein [Gemmataceae bacterium]